MFSTPVSWTRSLLAATIAIYAPFVAMFVCEFGLDVEALLFLPKAPGMIATYVVQGFFQSSLRVDLPDFVERFSPYATTAAFVVGVASLGRLGREWLVGGVVAAFFLNGFAAYSLIQLILM